MISSLYRENTIPLPMCLWA